VVGLSVHRRDRDRARRAAAGLDVSTAAGEATARCARECRLDLARDRHQWRLALVAAESRQAVEQPARVGMPRVGEDPAHRALLDELAPVHDRHAVAHPHDAAEVVADEQDRRAMTAPELADQIQHRGLDRDVEPGRRLVHDEQRRAGDERHRDHDPLLLAAGELVRIALHHRLGIGELDLGEHRESAVARGRRGYALVGHRGFHELPADRHHRIQARHGILVDHGDATPPDRAKTRFVQGRQIAALEADAAADDPAGAPEIAHDRQRHGRLAAAGLADEAERLAGVQPKAEPGNHRHLAGARRVGDAEILDVEQRAVSHGARAPAIPPRAG